MKNIIKLLTSILLLTVAILLFEVLFIPIIIISMILIIRKKDKNIALINLSNWIKKNALSIDRLGNVFGQKMFNWALIAKNSIHKFGEYNETISSVLGRNKRADTLSKIGKIVCWILDTIDKNHCVKSIGH